MSLRTGLRPATARLNLTRRTVLNKDTVREVMLGDGTGQCDPPEIGYHWARLPAGADENGSATYSAPFRVRANPAAGYLPRSDRRVFVALRNGAWVVQGPSLDDLEQSGIDARSLIPGTPEQAYIYLSDVVNLNALDLMDGLMVSVRELIFEIKRVIKIWRGTDATLHISLATSVPGTVDTHLYALLVFNITKYLANDYPLEVYAGTAISLFVDLGEADLQTCYDALPDDQEFFGIKAFYLQYGQTVISGPAFDVDVRQFINRSALQAQIALTSPNGTIDIAEPTPGDFEIDVADDAIGLDQLADGTPDTLLGYDGSGHPAYVTPTVYAPTNAHYLTTQTESGLSSEFNLGGLGGGVLKHTVVAGVSTPADAVPNTDYVPPTGAILTSPTINTGVSGTGIDDDPTFASPSSTKLPTTNAVKQYVDAVAQGLSVKYSVAAGTASALPANTYSNGSSGVGATLTGTSTGVLTVDGQVIALNDRVLVKDEGAPARNGIYLCTTEGAIGVAYVLTRALDMNQATEIAGAFTFVENGTVNDGVGFVVADPGPFIIGTTAIPWTQFSGGGTYSAGTGMQLTGTVFSIDSTVATLLGAQQLANKILTQLVLLIGGFKATFTHAFTADRTVTLPGDANIILVGEATAQALTNKTATSLILDTGVSGTAVDTDATFAANSDTLLASQKATKSYVDTVTQGLSSKNSVLIATTTALPANTYSNGSSGVGATLTANANGNLTIDGAIIGAGDRVLVKNEASASHNGIYLCTVSGALGSAYVLTRAVDSDRSAEIVGSHVFVEAGTVNGSSCFVCTNYTPITIGTTAINWTSPRINEILDSNGNEEIKFVTTTSAVNEVTVTNAATGGNPKISATGGDTNISLDIIPKGTGAINLDGAVVINESGADRDFRVEGDTNVNLMFADASADAVGFGTNTPSDKTMIHVVSTTKAAIPAPSMTAAQRDAISSPPSGAQVYVSDQKDISFYDSVDWYNLRRPFYSEILHPFSEHTIVAGTALAWSSDINQAGAGYYRRATPALNDEASYTVALPTGTFHVEFMTVKAASSGIMSIIVDGSTVSTHDLYSASITYNVRASSSNFNISTPGSHTLTIKAASKNGSSTNYFTGLSWLQFIKTAEYP